MQTKKRWLKVNEMFTEIPQDVDTSTVFEIEFGGSFKFQILNTGRELQIVNGMNGYGDNCLKEFEDVTPIILVEQEDVSSVVRKNPLGDKQFRKEVDECNFTDKDFSE